GAHFRSATGHFSGGAGGGGTLPVPGGTPSPGPPAPPYAPTPPFFADLSPTPAPLADVVGARVLCLLGDSVTTDHISPAGTIPISSPAGPWLVQHGLEPRDLHSFGSRRRHHQGVMCRPIRDIPL